MVILKRIIKIKGYYLIRINTPVNTNKIAKRYSIFFFVFVFPTNLLKPLPNKAQRLIVGKQISAAVIVTNITPKKILNIF